MQTFMPYPSFIRSLRCLDDKRLGKQRVKAFQLMCTLGDQGALDLRAKIKGDPKAAQWRKTSWFNHPASRMWRGYQWALRAYYNQSLACFNERGFRNISLEVLPIPRQIPLDYPPWMGDTHFHRSHQSNLLRKNFDWYHQFNWNVDDDMEYVWPDALNPTRVVFDMRMLWKA